MQKPERQNIKGPIAAEDEYDAEEFASITESNGKYAALSGFQACSQNELDLIHR